MNITAIANRLHELVEAGDYFTAYDELFSPEAWPWSHSWPKWAWEK